MDGRAVSAGFSWEGSAVSTAMDSDTFVRLLTDCQSRLYAYILAILPDSFAARDVLSETNMKLWRKWPEFERDREFINWAFKFAYYEVLTYQKRSRSDRHIFDGELLADLADSAVLASEWINEKLVAMEKCIKKLPAHDRQLITMRYQSKIPVSEIAAQHGKSPNAISHILFRIRSVLANCIERTVSSET